MEMDHKIKDFHPDGDVPVLSTTMNSTSLLVAQELDVFEHLYPAVADIFVVILCGYVCGRLGVISEMQSHGLDVFLSKFALPAMLFRAMALLDFSRVNWRFFSAVLISKAVVFAAVAVVVLLLSAKSVRYGRAGIFAIFATQSNDFALGYPIVEALYSKTYPEFLQYIYLLAPVSLVILNPIGFCLMEIQSERNAKEFGSHAVTSFPWLRTSWNIVRGLFTNPINSMTFLGFLANYIFDHKIPLILDGLLSTFANAFSSVALFFLGLRMVGKTQNFRGFSLVVPALLILAKLLLTPLVTRAVVGQLQPNISDSEYLNVGFLYGTFPTTPTVFVFATQYSKEIETIGTSLVLCTFVSGPWMFISAEIISLRSIERDNYADLLLSTEFQVGIISMAGSLWVVLVLILSKRWRRVLHSMTIGFLVSHMMSSFGMMLWKLGDPYSSWQHHAQFFMFFTGVIASRMWTAAIAVCLWLLNVRSLCVVLRIRWLVFGLCFGIPPLLTVILMAAGEHTRHGENPAFHYGDAQIILSAIILSLCFFVTVVFLVLGTMRRKVTKIDISELSTRSAEPYVDEDVATPFANEIEEDLENDTVFSRRTEIVDIEDLTPMVDFNSERYDATGSNSRQVKICNVVDPHCTERYSCNPTMRRSCRLRTRHYFAQINRPGLQELADEKSIVDDQLDPYQQQRHIIFLIMLSTSMLIGVFLCFWRISIKTISGSGIFIGLEFLDGLLMFGQGCLAFVVFGFDTQLVILPLYRRCKSFVMKRLCVPFW
ncbi:integral membrane protein GPR155-like isoform X2 [Paramacrobiotus metropolitanus]|uniref:integral membrane protein GPR155-like isoform X2 n=1 Tax=Paramacrobiotus metropolitanus TaxID=2943436 RepID=UPI00244567B7|nr:integral membrane protein GPR155-like isoform X2 [Paramacrobiotus metropolitanus]